MKKILLVLILITNHFYAQVAQNQWVWVGGSKVSEENTYELGATSNENNINFPGTMNGSAYITDSQNNIWFINNNTELWMYNPLTNNFTFKKGINNTYGYNKGEGIEHYRNLPPNIKNRQMWIDNNDDIWCFSGLYGSSSDQTNISALWKYKKSSNNWILIDEGTLNYTGNYGTIGIESSTNKPPVLENAITWTDNNNNLWMFGGHLLTTTDQTTNALWKYNISSGNWTWMSGSNLPNGINSFGPVGIESSSSIPGASDSGCGAWVDSQGFLWLFDTTQGPMNNNNNGYTASTNIWKYNTNTNLWTLVKQLTNLETIATVGTEHTNNSPSPISASTKKSKAIWEDLNGNIWYYYNSGNFDKLWKFNPLTNMWTLVKQISNNSVTGQAVGTINNSDINNTVGPRINCLTGTSNNNKLYLLGGNYASETGNGFKDVWEYEISSNIWKWIKGYSLNDNSINAQKIIKFNGVIESENSPGFIDGYNAKWEYNGDLYLYGAYDIMYNSHNVLDYTGGGKYFSKSIWKYHSNLKKWQVIHSFDERSQQYFRWNPVYNTKGIEDENNYPSIRQPLSPMSFTDNNGNLYMFGGTHTYSAGYYFNDLWKFNISTNRWVWISGTTSSNQSGIYGTQGIPNDTNMPGSREKGKTWSDSQGNLWLFGGKGYASSTLAGLNDLWKYDLTSNQWTWVKGSNLTGQAEISAGLGIADSNNTPPAFTNSLNWTDNSHNFWLYVDGAMWKFDTVSNNWIKLTNPATQNYGSIGVTSPSNNPGSISGGTTWTDTDGNLLFNSLALWKFDINTLMWTWIGGRRSGSQFTNSWKFGNYGQFNESFVSNFPGLRGNTVGWKDNNGNFFIYGGSGWDEDSEGSLSDVWMMNRKFNTIFGNIKFDNNNDGCISSNINAQNVKINIADGASNSFIFTNNLGNYSILAQNNNVTITPQQNYFSFTPNTQNFSFTGFGASQSQNFCATSNGTFNDLEIVIIPLTQTTPGADSKYKITYKNNGSTTLSGNIVFNYEDNLMDYVSSTILPANQSFGNINWNFSNLQPFEKRSIEVTFNLNTPLESPPLNSGDQLSFDSIINSNTTDETPLDNNFTLNQTVVNAFDPNDKTCLNGNVVSADKIGEYVYYKIRFENTGTANANHIVVTDDIDLSKFNIESIMPIEASHNYRMSVTGNKVEFLFEYINLPFAPSNLRFGYVVFKIKTKSSLVVGDTFSNLANIYFDYNSPIVTNNYTTTIQALGIQENELINTISVYPNPVKDILHFQTKENVLKVEIYDDTGRILSSKSILENKVDLSELKTGNYFLKLYTEKETLNTKIIKE